MPKEKLLIVGGFEPDPSKSIGGGILTSCLILKDSHIKDEFEILLLDSTSKSNPPPPLPVRLFWSALRFYKFLRIMYTDRPEVILLFTADGMSFLEKSLMGLVAEYSGSRSFIFLRANRLVEQIKSNRLFRILGQSLITKNSHLLCQGESVKDFGHRYLGYRFENTFVVPNWTGGVEATSAASQVIDDESAVKFIFVGWIAREKGVFALIDAFEKLHQAHPSAQLSFVGDGDDFDVLKTVVNRYNLESAVKLYGWIDSLKVKELLSTHHIFVLPSESEGMPNAVIEAMSVGLPVIATPVGVMPDYFTHDETVLFVEPNNVQQLQAALLKLYLDPERRAQIAEAGNNLVIRNFSPKIAIDRLISILKIQQ